MVEDTSEKSWAESVHHTPAEAFMLIIQQYCKNIDMEKWEYYKRRGRGARYSSERFSAWILTLFDRLYASMKNDTNMKTEDIKELYRLCHSRNMSDLLTAMYKLYAWLEDRGLMFANQEIEAEAMPDLEKKYEGEFVFEK